MAPLERLLAARVAVCWAAVNEYERRHWTLKDQLSINQADYQQRRIDAAHRRFLSATKTLAIVQKLVPAITSNLAKRQVGIAAAG
jgi:hypothetical protein